MNIKLPSAWLAGLAGVLTVGCARSPQDVWQSQLQKESSGPLGIHQLRVNHPRQPMRIDAIGRSSWFVTRSRRDARSLWAGVVPATDRGPNWWVFALADVHHGGNVVDMDWKLPELRQLQPARVREVDGRLQVVFDAPNPDAFARYVATQDRAWQQSHPSRRGFRHPLPTFPTGHEAFSVEQVQGAWFLVERVSAARWALDH